MSDRRMIEPGEATVSPAMQDASMAPVEIGAVRTGFSGRVPPSFLSAVDSPETGSSGSNGLPPRPHADAGEQSTAATSANRADAATGPVEIQAAGGPGRNQRLFSPRVLAGLAAGMLGLVVVTRQGLSLNWREVWNVARQANPWVMLLAFGVFYLMFPVRSERWRVLLQNAGADRAMSHRPSFNALTRVLYRAWFVNCVTVARLGDLYRADLLAREYGAPRAVSLGTIVAERLLDLVVLAAMLIVATPFAFHGQIPAEAGEAAGGAFAVGIGLTVLIVLAARFRTRLFRVIPARWREQALAMLTGATDAVGRWPLLLTLTAAGWLLEAATLWLVATAAGSPVSPAGALVVALAGAALSAIPITPSGTGFAEAGMIVLLIRLGVDPGAAAAVTLLTRLITYWSIVVLGALASWPRRSRNRPGTPLVSSSLASPAR